MELDATRTVSSCTSLRVASFVTSIFQISSTESIFKSRHGSLRQPGTPQPFAVARGIVRPPGRGEDCLKNTRSFGGFTRRNFRFFPTLIDGSHEQLAGDMKNFSNAAFSPDVIKLMTTALEAAVATLPEPVHSSHVNALAESILRTAGAGERQVANLQRIALLELQLAPRNG